jgi:hypothetical protein
MVMTVSSKTDNRSTPPVGSSALAVELFCRLFVAVFLFLFTGLFATYAQHVWPAASSDDPYARAFIGAFCMSVALAALTAYLLFRLVRSTYRRIMRLRNSR